jgi:hypothetical protein
MKDLVKDSQDIGTADKDFTMHSDEYGSKLVRSSTLNHQIYLTDIAVVPDIQENLLSVPRCDLAGAYAVFGNGRAFVTFTDLSEVFEHAEAELTATLDDEKLYIIDNCRPVLEDAKSTSGSSTEVSGRSPDKRSAFRAGDEKHPKALKKSVTFADALAGTIAPAPIPGTSRPGILKKSATLSKQPVVPTKPTQKDENPQPGVPKNRVHMATSKKSLREHYALGHCPTAGL